MFINLLSLSVFSPLHPLSFINHWFLLVEDLNGAMPMPLTLFKIAFINIFARQVLKPFSRFLSFPCEADFPLSEVKSPIKVPQDIWFLPCSEIHTILVFFHNYLSWYIHFHLERHEGELGQVKEIFLWVKWSWRRRHLREVGLLDEWVLPPFLLFFLSIAISSHWKQTYIHILSIIMNLFIVIVHSIIKVWGWKVRSRVSVAWRPRWRSSNPKIGIALIIFDSFSLGKTEIVFSIGRPILKWAFPYTWFMSSKLVRVFKLKFWVILCCRNSGRPHIRNTN